MTGLNLNRGVNQRGTNRYNNMWTVSILCDNFESLNCIGVADYVVQHLGSVFFDPTMQHELKKMELNRKAPNQGNSYGASTDPLGAVDLAEDDMWRTERRDASQCDRRVFS